LTHLECALTHLECDMTHLECDMTHLECDMTHLECDMTHLECDMTHVEVCDMTHVEVCDMTDPSFERPIKETYVTTVPYKRDPKGTQKRPIRDLAFKEGHPANNTTANTKETYKKDLQKRPICQHHTTKEKQKRPCF